MRTEKGIIGKLKQQYTFGHGVTYPEPQEWILDVNGTEYVANEANYKTIVKHSKQLIDLIEQRDIVEDKYNTYEVAFIAGNRIYCNDYNYDDSLAVLEEKDIKTILTKEQYEANCYKVGGEDE